MRAVSRVNVDMSGMSFIELFSCGICAVRAAAVHALNVNTGDLLSIKCDVSEEGQNKGIPIGFLISNLKELLRNQKSAVWCWFVLLKYF